MIKALVIDVDINDPETSINTAIQDEGITADQFLQALVLKEELKNNNSQIIIFYDEV